MLRGTLALASVHLYFVCLLCLTVQSVTIPCSQDLIPKIKIFISKAPNYKSLNCSLYTPNITDYQQKCPHSTLKCFAGEIKVLIEEWQSRSLLHTKLESLATSFDQMESGCRQCELLKEEKAEIFLEKLLWTIKMINNEHCPK